MSLAWPYQGHCIRIRPLTEADLPLLHQASGLDGFSHFSPHEARLYPDLAARQARFALLQEFDPPFEISAIVEDLAANPIGMMTLSGIDSLNGKAEFSLFLTPGAPQRLWEAWHYAMQQAFRVFGLYKMVFLVSARNSRVQQLLQRLEVRQEGCLRGEILAEDGQRLDLYRYAVDMEEWPASRLATFLARRGPLQPEQIPLP